MEACGDGIAAGMLSFRRAAERCRDAGCCSRGCRRPEGDNWGEAVLRRGPRQWKGRWVMLRR